MSGIGQTPTSQDVLMTDAQDHEGIATILAKGADVEILECDKTGNIRTKWLHTADDRVIPVIGLAG